jgi:hypothetical protein
MKVAVWEYQDPIKQTTHFRGYVKVYKENVVTRIPCDKVRVNKSQAKKDALKLIRTLKNNYDKNTTDDNISVDGK